MKVIEKGLNLLKSVKTYWKTPPEGRYIPFREIAAYSVGGIGVKFLVYMVGYIGLSGTSLLAGSALQLRNDDLVNLNMIATVLCLFLGFLRGMIIDNTRSKFGKFRPYLLFAGVPSAALLTVFALLPFETMSYNARLWSLFAIYMLLQLCYPFYDMAYSTLVQVMSPNSKERADVITVATFIYSIAPTIINILVPSIAGRMGGLEHIDAYRVILPGLGIFGAVLGLLVFSGTKERIIVAKDYQPKVPFFKGVYDGIKNKYQWSRSLMTWCQFLQMGVGNITTWYFYYGIKDIYNLTSEQQGVINGLILTVIGASATPAMLLSPFFIRKFGKKNLVIFYTASSVVCFIGMYISITVSNLYLLFAFVWLRGFFSAFPLINDPAIGADVLDYQQYKTGDRLEGLMGQFVGLIGTFLGMAATYFVNTVVMTNYYGLTNNYDDLYSAAFRDPLAKGVIILAIIGVSASLIPFILMYTLTEEEHEAHIAVLKIRAALEDYATDSLSEGQLENARKIYSDAAQRYSLLEKELPSLKGSKARKARSALKSLALILNEKERFTQEKMVSQLVKARKLLEKSVEELYGISEPTMERYTAAQNMPEETAQQQREKSAELKAAQKELDLFHKKAYDYIKARKLLKQYEYYSNWDDIFSAQGVSMQSEQGFSAQ